MTQDEAKTKRCGGPNGCGTLVNPILDGSIPNELLLQLAVEVNSPRWCIASNCMMWDPYEYYSDGKGGAWSQQNAEETLKIITGGDCGLKAKELECRTY